MFFEKSKLYKNKFFNSLLILTCLILIFIGKLDLIALRNLSSFLTDFFSPISSFVSKPALELENVIKDVQSATFLRDENIKLKSENRRLKIIETKLANTESELIELKKLLNFKINRNKIIFTGDYGYQWGKCRWHKKRTTSNLIFRFSRLYNKCWAVLK